MQKKRYKIYLIDDDEFLLDMYSAKFREGGFEVNVSFSASEALNKIKNGFLPDAVLVDLVMPDMDGFEFLRRLKENHLAPGSKKIILTNLGQKEDVDRGKSLDADDYIIKAYFTPSDAVKKIRALLERST